MRKSRGAELAGRARAVAARSSVTGTVTRSTADRKSRLGASVSGHDGSRGSAGCGSWALAGIMTVNTMPMPATTRLFGLLLVVLGLVSYVTTGRTSITALIPAFVGAVFMVLALVARAILRPQARDARRGRARAPRRARRARAHHSRRSATARYADPRCSPRSR